MRPIYSVAPAGQGNMKEMPYTEKAAKFFYDAMIGLCAMADKVATFMGSDDMIALAIDKNNHLLKMLDEKQ